MIRQNIIKPFLPKYEVVCTTYQVIPGLPVNGSRQKHAFDKGASLEARNFYVKVINSDMTKTMAPVEVLLKRRGKTIEKQNFGPVEELKKFNVVYRG